MREYRKAKMLAKFDTDRDGVLSDPEHEVMIAKHAARLKKFDTDGSGRLDPEEIKAARAADVKIRKLGAGPCGPPPQP